MELEVTGHSGGSGTTGRRSGRGSAMDSASVEATVIHPRLGVGRLKFEGERLEVITLELEG